MSHLSAPSLPASSVAMPVLSSNRKNREQRWSHRVPCLLRLLDASGSPAIEVVGETVNMSANGLALQVSEPIPAGVLVETVIAHKRAGESIVMRGTVVHSRRMLAGSFEIGVRAAGPVEAPVG